MSSTKVLYVCQEIVPYVTETELALKCRKMPQEMQERGFDIRTFMPKYGCINERRNQLHEVIRLSGMNLIISDADHQLIIKVASIPSARVQIYFIDNDDYFHRKHMLTDEEGKFFEDNDERAIFFARGVLETVRKLRWSPDIIHCHGWFSSMVPLYVKKIFNKDPLFANSKIITSLYPSDFPQKMNPSIKERVKEIGVKSEDDLKLLSDPSYENLVKFGLQYSDAAIIESDDVNADILKYIKDNKINSVNYEDKSKYTEAYSEIYEKMLKK